MRRPTWLPLAALVALLPGAILAAPPPKGATAPIASTSVAAIATRAISEGEASIEYFVAAAARLAQADTSARRQLLDQQLTMLRAQKAALVAKIRQLQEAKAPDEQVDALRAQLARVDAEIDRLHQEIARLDAEQEERRRVEAALATFASAARPGSPDYAKVWGKVPPARRDEALKKVQAALGKLTAPKTAPVATPALTLAPSASAAPTAR
jgi:septal ring factor EnvC (AmiA/AmiB activator)